MHALSFRLYRSERQEPWTQITLALTYTGMSKVFVNVSLADTSCATKIPCLLIE